MWLLEKFDKDNALFIRNAVDLKQLQFDSVVHKEAF